jgi:bile acid:Na+ symporter, BASS family
MNLVKITMAVLQASIFILVLSIGLNAGWRDATSLLCRPVMLLKSLLSMNVVMPIFAVGMAKAFGLYPAVKITLVLLAVSPVPPILPQAQLKLTDKRDYVIGLLATMALFSILTVPVAIEILAKVFSQPMDFGPLEDAKVVGMTILLPLSAGMLAHMQWPRFAERAGPLLGRIGNVLLLVAATPLLFVAWKPIVGLLDNGTLLAITAFIVVALVSGHLLGGPDPAERTTLALATASRHPGLAVVIAGANFPQHKPLVAATAVLYLVVRLLITILYNFWWKRRRSPVATPEERAA